MKKLSVFVNRKKPNKNGFCTFDEYCDINGINDIEETKKIKRYKDYYINYSILKIDLKNHDISLWFDDSSDSKNCVYTLEAIPPTLIEEIELKDIYER